MILQHLASRAVADLQHLCSIPAAGLQQVCSTVKHRLDLETANLVFSIYINCQLDNHTEERDSHVLDILTAIIESSHEAIPLSGRPPSNNPDKKCPVTKAVPGWKEMVKPQRETSLFWHAVWVSDLRPNTGVLFDIMKKTRNQYHFANLRAEKTLRI